MPRCRLGSSESSQVRIEDVRVAAHHLLADASEHVFHRELTGLRGHLRQDHDLKHDIAELLGASSTAVLAVDRIDHLEGLLDQIRSKALGVCA